MVKELIYTDSEAVKNTMNYINRSKPYLQNVYNSFKSVGITPTLEDISKCLHVLSLRWVLSELENWMSDYLVDRIENPEIEGIPVKREALKNIIQIPDCSSLFDEFDTLIRNISAGGVIRMSLEVYYEISGDIISIKSDVEESVTEENSYYATTDRQVEILSKIKNFLSAWQDFYQYATENNLRNAEHWVGDMGDLSFFNIKNKQIVLGVRTNRYIKDN